MIKVSCDACGAGFSAKDELAGRRGKCPSCKAPIVVPELETEDDDFDEQEDQTAAQVVSSRRASHGGSSRRGGSGRGARTPRKKSKAGLMTIIVAVVALGAVGTYYALQTDNSPDPYALGMEHLSLGEFDKAIAEFDKLVPGTRIFDMAVESRQSAVERRDAGATAASTRKSKNLYNLIVSVEKNQVARKGKGHLDPNYAPYTRYLLKRCAEFKEDYPTSTYIPEIDAIMWRYSEVASLDKPPTEADTRAEMGLRMIMQNPNYKDSLLAVDEFASASPDQVEVVREMRNEIAAHAREYWNGISNDLKRYMNPGEENWQHVANEIATYLKKIEAANGLVPSAEAYELQKKAAGA